MNAFPRLLASVGITLMITAFVLTGVVAPNLDPDRQLAMLGLGTVCVLIACALALIAAYLDRSDR